jgi:hypothetical protein
MTIVYQRTQNRRICIWTAMRGSAVPRRTKSAWPRPERPQDWQQRVMPKGFVSEEDLDPRAFDLRICVTLGFSGFLESNNRRSETCIKCPRTDTHLIYMIDIALTTEFAIAAGGVR